MSKTTLDLSTLSGIADGAHTVKVKAKADGYMDSEFSNEVSWTKSSAVAFTFFFTSGETGDDIPTYMKIGSAPTSADDYDYVTKGDGSHEYDSSYLYNKAGTKIVSAVGLTAQIVYVWGFKVKKNTSTVNLYTNFRTYDKALDISPLSGDIISIQCQYFYD